MSIKTTKQRIFLSPPHLSGEELELVREAFASNYIAPLGPMVEAFEREFSEYTGISNCLAVSSGTAAMHLALRHILQSAEPDCRPQSSAVRHKADAPKQNSAAAKPIVLASTLTFIGSVSPVIYENAEPVFIDCDRESWNMDPDLLENALAEYAAAGIRPAAVIPTDLYGQCCDLPRLKEACDKYNVPVICDSAEAMGAWHEAPETISGDGQSSAPRLHAGRGATASIYSFNGNKIITSSGGGMLASENRELMVHARKLATQAREPVTHYEHREIGFNYRMSNIVAAVGLGQLRVLDERINQAKAVFDGYRERLAGLPGIRFMPEAPFSRCNRWLTVITVDKDEFGVDKQVIQNALEAENIEARPVWKPMHLQPVFQGCRIIGGAVSEELFDTGLCLPSGTAMTDADLDRICHLIRGSNSGVQPATPDE